MKKIVIFLSILLICSFVATAGPVCNSWGLNDPYCNTYSCDPKGNGEDCTDSGCDYCLAGPSSSDPNSIGHCSCQLPPVPEFSLIGLVVVIIAAIGIGYHIRGKKK